MNSAAITHSMGHDGTRVIHIDTPGLPEDGRGPLIRIYLNDEPVFENPTYAPTATPDQPK